MARLHGWETTALPSHCHRTAENTLSCPAAALPAKQSCPRAGHPAKPSVLQSLPPMSAVGGGCVTGHETTDPSLGQGGHSVATLNRLVRTWPCPELPPLPFTPTATKTTHPRYAPRQLPRPIVIQMPFLNSLPQRNCEALTVGMAVVLTFNQNQI